MAQNKAALDQQLTIKENMQAQIDAERRKEADKVQIDHQTYLECQRLEKDIKRQEQLWRAMELDIQMKLFAQKQQQRTKREADEYASLRDEIQRELLEEQKQKIEKQRLLLEDQTLYCELINQRKQKLLELDKASDKAFLDEQKRRDALSYQKEKDMLERQTAIDTKYRN